MNASEPSGFTFGTWRWWIGVVENRKDDPEKLGRVQVRIFGYHSQSKSDIPTADLPWAAIMMPPDSASSKGIGASPTGIQEGSHVVGFFMDGDNAQTPVVMGTLVGKPNNTPDTYELTRGEDLDQTFVQDKLDGVLNSSISSSLSNVSALADSLTSLTATVNNTLADVRNFAQNLDIAAVAAASLDADTLVGQLDQSGLLSSIPGLNGLGSRVIGPSGGLDIRAISSTLSNHLGGLGNEIEVLTSSIPLLSDVDEIKNVMYQVQALSRQYRDIVSVVNGAIPTGLPGAANVLNAMNLIPSTSAALSKVTSALSSAQSLIGAVSQVKSAASIIGGAMAAVQAIKTGALANKWKEPKSPAAPEYPYNNLMHTEGGHVEEFDNTPGKERYQRYHPAGSFIEVHPDGTQVEKIVKDNYKITMGDDFIHVDGHVKVNIGGNATIAVGGSCGLRVDGDMTHIVDGDYSLAVSGEYSVSVGGAHKQSAGTQFQAKAPRIDLN